MLTCLRSATAATACPGIWEGFAGQVQVIGPGNCMFIFVRFVVYGAMYVPYACCSRPLRVEFAPYMVVDPASIFAHALGHMSHACYVHAARGVEEIEVPPATASSEPADHGLARGLMSSRRLRTRGQGSARLSSVAHEVCPTAEPPRKHCARPEVHGGRGAQTHDH